MKKNGFTLIELIATIGLLGMLSTILITVSIRKINETKESARDTMIKSIELSAVKYVNDYKEELDEFNINDNIYVSLQTLVEKEYFTESLIDPTTDKTLPLSDDIYVTREQNGKINAHYDVKQKNKIKIILNGPYNQYIEKSDSYEDLGATAIDKNGNDVSSSIVVSGTIDMTKTGKNVITYKYGDNEIKRNVYLQNNIISFAGSEYLYTLLENENTLNNGLFQSTAEYTNEGIKLIVDSGVRYVGDNPNNKVYFNCEDKDTNNIPYGKTNYDYASSCEVWRIIGVFDVEDEKGSIEKRIKIINSNSSFKASWDSSASDINNGYGVNQWGPSTYEDGSTYEGADLMRLLNGYYIGKDSACTYCNGGNQATCSQVCDTEDKTLTSQNMNPLTNSALRMTENAVWYTYARALSSSNTYLEERGITSKYTGCITLKKCTMDGVTRDNVWTGLVGLMLSSDILYANGWLNYDTIHYSLTITPFTHSSYGSEVWYSSKEGIGAYHANSVFMVWPTLYLKSNIEIIGGNGNTEPYILK